MNALLTILTARTSFVSPFLTTEGAPINLADTPDLKAARACLWLDRTKDDYAVVGALSLLEGVGQPVVSSLLGGILDLETVSYAPSAFRPVPARIHGGVLLPTYEAAPKLGIAADNWPPTTEYRITSSTPTASRWEDGTGAQQVIATQVSNGVVRLAWPVSSISGWIQPNTPWTVGSQLIVTGFPLRFPHAAINTVLNSQRWADRLLEQAGLSGYRMAQNAPEERNAAVYAAIAYATWKENREAFA